MEKIKIGNTTFDVDFCKSKSADKLRKIYNGEPKEVLDELISKIHPKNEKQNNKQNEKQNNKKLSEKESKDNK